MQEDIQNNYNQIVSFLDKSIKSGCVGLEEARLMIIAVDELGGHLSELIRLQEQESHILSLKESLTTPTQKTDELVAAESAEPHLESVTGTKDRIIKRK